MLRDLLTLWDAARLHGHLGPFLTIGYIAGLIATMVLSPTTEHDLEAEIEVFPSTPYTCVVDGVQCSTRCTLGKGNIRISPADRNIIRFKFMNRRHGSSLLLKVRETLLDALPLKGNLHKATSWILGLSLSEIFEGVPSELSNVKVYELLVRGIEPRTSR